jgi:hypothetical protein
MRTPAFSELQRWSPLHVASRDFVAHCFSLFRLQPQLLVQVVKGHFQHFHRLLRA